VAAGGDLGGNSCSKKKKNRWNEDGGENGTVIPGKERKEEKGAFPRQRQNSSLARKSRRGIDPRQSKKAYREKEEFKSAEARGEKTALAERWGGGKGGSLSSNPNLKREKGGGEAGKKSFWRRRNAKNFTHLRSASARKGIWSTAKGDIHALDKKGGGRDGYFDAGSNKINCRGRNQDLKDYF